MGRGVSRSRSLTGRLTNKLKRGVRTLSNTNDRSALRTRSQMERTEAEVTNKKTAKKTTSSSASAAAKQQEQPTDAVAQKQQRTDQSVDGGRAVHRNIVAQVRARSALLRQRAMSRTDGINANNRINNSNNQNVNEDDDDDLASEPDDERVARPEILLRYKTAGKICDEAIKEVVKNVAPGASVFNLCNLGDQFIEEKCASTFTKAKDPATGEPIKRGIAFPTNVSVNNVLCHFRPLSDDARADVILAEGDVVKIHLGSQLDGFATTAATTVVCSSASSSSSANQQGGVQLDADDAGFARKEGNIISPAAANAVACAHNCMTALIRGMRLGASGAELTDLIKSFASNYGVEACEGVLSNRTKRWILDGSSCIINRRVVAEGTQMDVADVEIEPYQVWTLDVAFTTGQTYKLVPEEGSIYRRNELPTPHDMRIRSADSLLNEIRTHFLCFPFCPTQSEIGTNHARLGVSQLLKVGVIDVVPPMRAKHGVITTRACCTIAVTEKRIHILSGAPVLDRIAANIAVPLAPSLVDYTTKPLTFTAEDASNLNNNEGGAEDAEVQTKKSRQFVEDSMNSIGQSGLVQGMSKQQIASLLPPGKNKNNNKRHAQIDDAKLEIESNANQGDDVARKQSASNNKNNKKEGQKPLKARKVEQD